MTSIQRRIVGFSTSMVLAGFVLAGLGGTAHAQDSAEAEPAAESATESSTETSGVVSNLTGDGGLVNIFIGNYQVRE